VILLGENKKRFPQMVPIIDAVDHMAQTWSIDTCGNEMNGVRQLAPHMFHFNFFLIFLQLAPHMFHFIAYKL
jgi:hypothetical protein